MIFINNGNTHFVLKWQGEKSLYVKWLRFWVNVIIDRFEGFLVCFFVLF